MIPEPFRSRLREAIGHPDKIDAIRKEAALAHPKMFQPFNCAECCLAPHTKEGDLQCRGKNIPLDNTAYCRDFKPRRPA